MRAMAKHVLVVEDDESITTSLSFLLTRAGFEVAVESDGTKALDTILAQVPDVLLLDVMLPRMDGYEVLRRVRADQRRPVNTELGATCKAIQVSREELDDRLHHYWYQRSCKIWRVLR